MFILSTWRRLFGALAAVLAVSAAPAHAAPYKYDAYDGRWHFSLTPYLWLTGVEGSLAFPIPGNGGSANFGTSAGDVLSMLKFGIMGAGDARIGDWSVFGDFIYADLGTSKGAVRTVTGPGGLIEIPINVTTKASFQQALVTVAGAYSLYHDDEGTSADVFLGTRYFGTKATLDFNFAGPLNLLPQSGRLRAHNNIWNAIVGMKGRYAFADSHWFLDGYGDVGTGESNLTYEVAAGPGYAFDWGDLFLLYRYLHFGQGSSSARLVKSLNTYGPELGLTFHF